MQTAGTEGSFTSSDGLRLHYRIDGPPAGELLVCSPGGPGRAAEYLGDLGGLTGTRRVVRFDARGTGRSEAPDGPDGYAEALLADDLDRLRAELGLERMDLLGHSAGGRVALGYAAAHPERLRRLVLVTTFLGNVGDEERERIRASRAGEPWYAEAAEAAEAMAYARPAEQQRLSRLQRPFYYARWDAASQAHAAAADQQSNPRAEAGVRQGFSPTRELAPRLAAVQAPVLVVAGELDVLTPPSSGAQVAGALPTARLELIPGVGHFPWVDEPAAFRTVVEGFLASTAADRAAD